MKHQRIEHFRFEDESEERLRILFEQHHEEARTRAFALIEGAREDENGCLVSDTVTPRKVRFRGHQYEVYRFVYCVLNEVIASRRDVVRHRCHNRLCVNPEHLILGTQADNKHDDWDYAAYGVDPDFL